MHNTWIGADRQWDAQTFRNRPSRHHSSRGDPRTHMRRRHLDIDSDDDGPSGTATRAGVSIVRVLPPVNLQTASNPWQQTPPGPVCPMLMGSSKRHIALWRQQLEAFEEELWNYNVQYGQRFNPSLRLAVHHSVWAIISQQLLHPLDKSDIGGTPNHVAVERYLRGVGRYCSEHGRPGEVYCADPLAVYRGIPWPDVTALS